MARVNTEGQDLSERRFEQIIGNSRALEAVLERVERVCALSRQKKAQELPTGHRSSRSRVFPWMKRTLLTRWYTTQDCRNPIWHPSRNLASLAKC
jgi:hypothetical protein